ncbi:dihydroorotate oxidase [Bacteroidetes bacterium endosymbiont of Geopemphigus sp.]|uniref:dihydroorotate oxidase n=1 Tax=Bacteroidetes bacterium endosymbiont of Geopemphigus sp. TaxID=2047937 RepID=UPI000CD19159|nr:dihydroorotate oxidase [Bacteroidetes bacterium endosymbiont of Geopemphigus sp.]
MTQADLSTHWAGVSLSSCIVNASGAWCSTFAELMDLTESTSGAVLTKSATLYPRKGNLEPRYFQWTYGSINSMGLPNLGIDFYLDFIRSQGAKKPIFLSLAAMNPEELSKLLQRLRKLDFPVVTELNLSCPNLIGKPQLAYDFSCVEEILKKVFDFYEFPLGVKLPPYFDTIHFEEMAELLNCFPLKFVTCINSPGNALFVDPQTESVVIKPKEGFGGIGGPCIKPIALANVNKFFKLLKSDIQLIGCGGVSSGQDIFEHILCGASLVQVGTQLMKEGPGVFERLQEELCVILDRKSYTSIEEFRGKLKSLG